MHASDRCELWHEGGRWGPSSAAWSTHLANCGPKYCREKGTMRESTQKPDPVEALRGWRRKRPEKGGERQRTTVFRSATLLGAAIIAAAAAGGGAPGARAEPRGRSFGFPAPPGGPPPPPPPPRF